MVAASSNKLACAWAGRQAATTVGRNGRIIVQRGERSASCDIKKKGSRLLDQGRLCKACASTNEAKEAFAAHIIKLRKQDAVKTIHARRAAFDTANAELASEEDAAAAIVRCLDVATEEAQECSAELKAERRQVERVLGIVDEGPSDSDEEDEELLPPAAALPPSTPSAGDKVAEGSDTGTPGSSSASATATTPAAPLRDSTNDATASSPAPRPPLTEVTNWGSVACGKKPPAEGDAAESDAGRSEAGGLLVMMNGPNGTSWAFSEPPAIKPQEEAAALGEAPDGSGSVAPPAPPSSPPAIEAQEEEEPLEEESVAPPAPPSSPPAIEAYSVPAAAVRPLVVVNIGSGQWMERIALPERFAGRCNASAKVAFGLARQLISSEVIAGRAANLAAAIGATYLRINLDLTGTHVREPCHGCVLVGTHSLHLTALSYRLRR